MDTAPTYAKSGGPPEDWRDLIVLRDGVRIHGVIEVNCDAGWAIVEKRDAQGAPVVERGWAVRERIEGAFRLVHRTAAP